MTKQARLGYTLVLVSLAIVATAALWTSLMNTRVAEGQAADAVYSSASRAFIKFEGIDGESTDDDHKGWSDLVTFDQIIHTPGTTAADGTWRPGVAVLEDIVVTKDLDKASPKLAEAVCRGKMFPLVQVHVARNFGVASTVVYYAYELRNVIVTSYSVGGSTATGGIPMEQVSLNFEEIKVTYTEFDAMGRKKGNVEYTWNVAGAAR